MADVQLSVQSLTPGGVAPSFSALNATDVYYAPRRGGRTILWFKNTGSEATITFDVTQSVEGLGLIDPTVTVPATTGERAVGNLPALYEVVGGANDGKVKFSCSVASGVTVAAVSL